MSKKKTNKNQQVPVKDRSWFRLFYDRWKRDSKIFINDIRNYSNKAKSGFNNSTRYGKFLSIVDVVLHWLNVILLMLIVTTVADILKMVVMMLIAGENIGILELVRRMIM